MTEPAPDADAQEMTSPPPAELIGGDRHITTCSMCWGADDHPKHATTYADSPYHHLDCGERRGCENCCKRITGRPAGAIGQAMLDHILERIADGRAAGDSGLESLPGDERPTSSDTATTEL